MKMFNDSHLEVKKFFKGTFFTHPVSYTHLTLPTNREV